MPHYRLHLLNRDFEVSGICTADFQDDAAACAWADNLAKGEWWELWRGEDRVRCNDEGAKGWRK